jgi:hypothetical protein
MYCNNRYAKFKLGKYSQTFVSERGYIASAFTLLLENAYGIL